VYDSLSLIFKDADQVDRFMKNSIKPPQGNIRTINQSQDSIAAVTARLEAQMEQKIEAHNA
jgi:predicted nuclease of predicted toxin-antitoxin system